jgi:ribosomal protein L11 methyltransferase
MKRNSLVKISVATTAEAADAVSEGLARVFNRSASTHTDFRTGRTTVSIYTDAPPVAVLEQRAQLRQILIQLKTFGLNLGSGRIRVEEIRHENWAESWKRHFKAIEVGSALLVKPSWIKQSAKPGQELVVLDPGLSFGTGQHPTTSFCLRELVRRRPAGDRTRRGRFQKPKPRDSLAGQRASSGKTRSCLDIGTGSGILAIAAVKLGYAPVRAFDFDPESVRVARANARVNRVEHKLRITRRDLARLAPAARERYDCVCANLISTLLIGERERLVARVKPGGALVVAGILQAEFRQVRAAFEPLGLRLVANKREQEWASGTFVLRR